MVLPDQQIYEEIVSLIVGDVPFSAFRLLLYFLLVICRFVCLLS